VAFATPLPKALGVLLSNGKSIGMSLWSIVIVAWCCYALYSAYFTGSIRLKKLVVTLADDPIMFWIGAAIYSIFLAIGLFVLGGKVDQKVGQYGGNYNFATLKAILRGK
jgi:hypothetical protein